ncbi:metal ABC transporter permease [Motilibacter aurantiacus]|uniref:metal ABC transporter permease n=1 Tax=Motilibacter aurantiacus TaxID=2714955 RepID=UPI001407BEC5|nr:metal ABC transporter permease [Motilibacter aurantiacus]NHC44111.1 metal ABC transporter permease [Motilibacter aurantiacus]
MDAYTLRALIEAALVGAIGGLVGVHVVLRRLSFFTMAMTHATFPGVVLAAILGINIFVGGWVFGVFVAVGVAGLARGRGQDFATATGVVLSAGFALGVVLVSAQEGFSKDLSAYLVGSILTVQTSDVVITAGVLVAVAAVLAVIGKELVFGAFDPTGLRAAGYPSFALDLAVLLLVEIAIVTAVPSVGTILSVALIVAPAAAARLWVERLGPMTGLAVLIGSGCGVLGVLVSQHVRVATGGAITLGTTVVFVLSVAAAPALRRVRARRLQRELAAAA